MYKLLVVDDEYYIRDCVTTIIDWNSIGIEIIGTAIDGEDARQKVELLAPDIVITDIRMDKVDGLDFADALRRDYPFIKVIIMSGYDDFDYIKKALEIKVFTYLLKPMRPDELVEAVQNVIKAIEEEKKLVDRIQKMELEIDRDRYLLIDRFISDLMKGNHGSNEDIQASMTFLNIILQKSYYCCIIISIVNYYEILKDLGLKKLHGTMFSIKELLNNILSDYEIWALIGDDGNLKSIIGSDLFIQGAVNHKLITALEQVTAYIAELLGISVSISIGGVYQDLLELSKSYEEALLVAEHNTLAGGPGIVHINDLSSHSEARYIYPAAKEELLFRNLLNSTEERLASLIKELFHDMVSQNCSRDRMRIDILGLIGKITRKAMDMGIDMYSLYNHKLLDPYNAFERYNTNEQIENWLVNIIVKTVDAIKKKQGTQLKSVIIKANRFLQENYANPNLTLEVISDNLFLNPAYFSRLYKKETGENYVDALIRIRMEKAKILLRETNKKITDISESVGYPVPKYFYAIFKKYTGLTPLEFRELQKL